MFASLLDTNPSVRKKPWSIPMSNLLGVKGHGLGSSEHGPICT